MENESQTKLVLQVIGKVFWLSTSFACWALMDLWGWGIWAILLALPAGIILSSLLAMLGTVFWLLSQVGIFIWVVVRIFS